MSNAAIQTSQPEPRIRPEKGETFERFASISEIRDIPHDIEKIPMTVWAVALAGAAERLAFYAATAPWRTWFRTSGVKYISHITKYPSENYLQNDRLGSVPGALGLGQSRATIISNCFFLLSYLTPMPMAIMSDTRLGRYRTIWLGIIFYMCGLIILFATSLPHSVHSTSRIAGFGISMVLISLGVGGVKSSIAPFMIDQYAIAPPRFIHTNGKDPYIGDRDLTIQYIYNVYYWFVNIAGMSSIPSTWLEKTYGFWAAYLLAWCSLWVFVGIFLLYKSRFLHESPQGNILPKTTKLLAIAAKENFNISRASPPFQLANHGKEVPWDEEFVAQIEQGLLACRTLLCFSLFELCLDQIQNNLVSQAGQMRLGHVPNDALQALNPAACVLLGPIVQHGLYRLLRKRGVKFRPIARIATSFIVLAIAMGYASGTQGLIYSRPPCYDRPFACPGSKGGKLPNDISVWIQTPVYFLIALAELLGVVTMMELSYPKAPRAMMSIVQAFSQMSSAIGAGLGMAISPAAKDPHMVVLYAVLAGTTLVSSALFYWLFFSEEENGDE